MDSHGVVIVSKNDSDRITVSFRYDPLRIEKIKTIHGRKWHKDEKYWSFPNTDGTLEKILEVFKDEEIHIDPALQAKPSISFKAPPSPVIARPEGPKQSQFEDLRRELISRKYSYKTVKGYLYYNRDFLSFIRKDISDIKDSDIKDYLVYLAEEKESATATLNQAINALKFYYGGMLKKSFLYEIKRPRKDKQLPEVLSRGSLT